ncbi:threonine/serine exporter ThrE family protein [Selenomonas sp. F0473]|uniref:threonine/serine ThrE exporter family protein n=1 Tax=Selenomonas sp. F0473 TaxID=999423 RepID=UPI00029E1F6E|nr:threonine/serine exporter family protein [Selenomonas sp. F0473]EKU71593.1 hypothetical protein HMPREF9161_00278 [Selenomonas sp. F0473]
MFTMINEKQRININNILERAIDIGQRMLVAGAEVSRVERTIDFICRAYGVRHVDVMVITSSIVVTIRGADIGVLTQMRRVPPQNFDFQRLKALNQLSREICAQPRTSDEIKERIRRIDAMEQLSLKASVFYWALIAASFSAFFGGRLEDAVCAGGVGALLRLLQYGLSLTKLNAYCSLVLLSFVGGMLANSVLWFGMDIHPAAINMGNIMPVIPGLALMNSIRDMFSQETISGLLKSAEAIILSLLIAAGFAFSATGTIIAFDTLWWVYLLTSLTGGFCFHMLFHGHIKDAGMGALVCMGAWAFTMLFVALDWNEFAGYFAGAVFATIAAEILARFYKCPATIFLIIGVIAMVPGGALYRTMFYAVSGDWGKFGTQGIKTFLYAVSIAAGIVIATAVWETIKAWLISYRKRGDHNDSDTCPVR